MVATAIYSVNVTLWKETAFPLWRAIERRWKSNVVSRVSSVIVIGVTSYGALGHVPPLELGHVKKIWQFLR